jgi:hypothetical protein
MALAGIVPTEDKTLATWTPALTEKAWRGVSFGMKIKCINEALADQGWWQAIRIRPCPITWDLNGNSLTPGDLTDVIPDIASWPNDPSYSSGKLRDLYRKDFILATEDNEHQWKYNPGVALAGAAQDEFVNDKSFDMIAVHVSGTADTRIMIDSYGNYETTYNPGTKENRFQTHSAQVSPKYLNSIQQKKRRKTKKAAS